MTRAWLRKGCADTNGAAALELALVLPPLVIFIFGIWYIGWSLNLGGEVRHAVELGSRIYITNPTATTNDLQTAVASHLTDVPIGSVTLATSTSTVGTATSQHITWSFQTTAPIPFMNAIPTSFSGSYDVPAATP
jgi:Flp pilus assembly protein TadG